MNKSRVISTAVLFLLLGATVPAFAQERQKEKGGKEEKAQQAQHQQKPQHAKQAQRQRKPEHAQQAQRQQPSHHAKQAQHTQQARHTQQAQHRGQQGQRVAHNRGNNGNHHGRISDSSYRAHFGNDHSFRMNRPRMIGGYNRFQYSGYTFGFNQPWPIGWSYSDNVYVEYVGGGYYLCNPRYPGVQITLNLF